MSKKQTAIEWFISQISTSKYFIRIIAEIENKNTIYQHNSILTQAIEKEKKQITEAFKEGIAYWNGDEWKLINIEGYYDDLYNNNKQ